MLEKKQGIEKGIILSSISASIYYDSNKPKDSLVIVSYSKGDANEDVKFVVLKAPVKGPFKREDIIKGICEAEKIRNLTYVDFDGKDKDIYICHPGEGEVYEFVERDETKNRYIDGFAEVEASQLRFSANIPKLSFKKPIEIDISFDPDAPGRDQNGLEYAIYNAYNACILGKMFSKEEFHLETGDGERVKYEVRTTPSKYIDLSTLYIHPQINEGNKFVTTYITEPINVINGDEMQTKTYKITYSNKFKGYYISR